MERRAPTDGPRIAIVGGGITGAMVASELAHNAPNCDVHLFDQGRRGPGGRASHRAVADGKVIVKDDREEISPAALRFDHGCQFTRADDSRMRALVERWVGLGWAAEWRGRFGVAGEGEAMDFFGLPSHREPVFVGVGGMHMLPRRVLANCGATLHRGVRVARMERDEATSTWTLHGVGGEAAYHDTAEASAAAAAPTALGSFDIVVLTDVSSSFGSWHRASAGLPPDFGARVGARVRVPLFAAMVAFREPLNLPLDAITFAGSGLWFAARSQSKPGLGGVGGGEGDCECWTLVSTPRFAADEISDTPMQDASTGAFKPQEDSYLNTGPAPALLRAFEEAVAPLRQATDAAIPPPMYLQGQRWGSALPAPSGVGGRDRLGRGASTVTLSGVQYEKETPPLVYAQPRDTSVGGGEGGAGGGGDVGASRCDFVADDALGLYYAGDFCSHRPPGFEAATLSALDVAAHICARMRERQRMPPA